MVKHSGRITQDYSLIPIPLVRAHTRAHTHTHNYTETFARGVGLQGTQYLSVVAMGNRGRGGGDGSGGGG